MSTDLLRSKLADDGPTIQAAREIFTCILSPGSNQVTSEEFCKILHIRLRRLGRCLRNKPKAIQCNKNLLFELGQRHIRLARVDAKKN